MLGTPLPTLHSNDQALASKRVQTYVQCSRVLVLNPLSCIDTPENRKKRSQQKARPSLFHSSVLALSLQCSFRRCNSEVAAAPRWTCEVAIRYATAVLQQLQQQFCSSCDSYTYVAIANTIFTLIQFLLTTFQSAVSDNLLELFLNNFDNAMPICMHENITENLNFKNSTEVQNVPKQKDGHVSASYTLKI